MSNWINLVCNRKDKDKEALLESISNCMKSHLFYHCVYNFTLICLVERHGNQLIEKINNWQEIQKKELGQLLAEEDENLLENMHIRQCSLHLKKNQIIDSMISSMERQNKMELNEVKRLLEAKNMTKNELKAKILQQVNDFIIKFFLIP